jgi:hypothetical protein
MTQPGTGTDEAFFLFSPSSSYPQPFACLIDRQGALVHAWSSPLDQPDPRTDPPTYLRGWNHVELGADGSLYVTVPLHSLLKLRPDSSLIWRAPVPAHHDLDIGEDGEVYVLTERPRLVRWRGGEHVLLDNLVTILDAGGRMVAAHSLYDVLTTQPVLRSLIDEQIERRRAGSQPVRLPAYQTAGRQVLAALRDLPGSPCDVLHPNTVEVLNAHPDGLWSGGDVMVSLRSLDVIAVLDLSVRSVRWWWGPGELSGQHQPSAVPGGNVLVFDNGQAAGRSRAIEIDPRTGSIMWQYTADPPESLFTPLAGGCQLLASRHVLITDAQSGRAIEVTRDGRPVWGVQIHQAATPTATSRAAIYRLSAVPAAAALALDGGDETARQVVAQRRLRCELIGDNFPPPSRRVA